MSHAIFRKISGLFLPLQMLRCTRPVVNYQIRCNETRSTDDESQYVRAAKDIPGPKALPLLGNWFRFLPHIGKYGNASIITQMRMLRDQYGNIVKLDGLINRPCIFLFRPELCEQMYRSQGSMPLRIATESFDYYRKCREYIFKGQYGLTISQGKGWQDFRLKVNPHMMQPRSIKAHVAHINEITSEFVKNMETLRDPTSLELSNNFMNELYKWGLESMASIGLGCRLGSLKPNLAVDSEAQIMINCVRDMFELLYHLEMLLPLWKIYNTPNLKKFFNVLDTIYEIANKYIKHAETKFRNTAEDINLQDCSVLEKLIHVDEQTAYIMALDMLMGGIDTTGNASGAMLYYIANNIEKQEKLREEVMSVLPDKTSPVTYDILQRTTYAKACIKESMRLFPIVNGVVRTMQKDICLGGYKIPKGFNVFACHALFLMDPMQFPRPDEYIPERWLRNNIEFSKAHPFAYMPFGYGVRTCIGRRFAEMELEMLLLKVIRNFQIEWHHEPLEYKCQIVNTLTTPLRLKLIDL